MSFHWEPLEQKWKTAVFVLWEEESVLQKCWIPSEICDAMHDSCMYSDCCIQHLLDNCGYHKTSVLHWTLCSLTRKSHAETTISSAQGTVLNGCLRKLDAHALKFSVRFGWRGHAHAFAQKHANLACNPMVARKYLVDPASGDMLR